jgi:tetratricopeptide (TPR) repeat protein
MERRVALFLGSGVNYGLKNSEGIECPLGLDLSDMIARDVLNMPGGRRPLDNIAEMARFRVGSNQLNSYLYKLFKGFAPSTQHLCLAQLPWNVIYTTNYDTLVEEAADNTTITPAGKIRRVVSVKDSLNDFSEQDIPYFKLHGCIEVANSDTGRLILTREDYRFYEQHRRPLFRRLREDLVQQTLLFIGYSLDDDNFRQILDDCRKELNTESLPHSFAIRVGVSDSEKAFWREKYNITTLNSDAQVFLQLLKGTWNAQNCTVVPFSLRHTKEYTKFDDNTSFQKVGESFYLVKPEDCTSSPDPKAFYSGSEPTWGDVRDGTAPARDASYALLDAMIDELFDPAIRGGVYLVTGAAGTGKTTLVRGLAYELASSSIPTIIHIPGTPLDDRVLGTLLSDGAQTKLVVIIEHAAERILELEQFIGEIRRKKLPVTVVASERKNLWEFASSRARQSVAYAEFELGRLSSEEIKRILDALEKHDALGKLTGNSREYQVEHFEMLADKELLVALRELTSMGTFDDIMRDEYRKLPSEIAKCAYAFVAALGQIDQPIRLEVLARLLEIGVHEIGSQVMLATEGVLLTGEDFGTSRHNAGFRVQARHPVIASVIFAYAAPDDQAKYEKINSLITHLNVSFPEDARVLSNIVRHKDLINTIASRTLRRNIFDRLETVLPGDPYVLQHRSLLERELGSPDAAIKFARAAIEIQPHNPAFKNTLGYAYEAKARDAEPLERNGLLQLANRIFDEGVAANPTDPYSYLGLYQVMKQRERLEVDRDRKMKLKIDMFSMLEEAYETTGRSHKLATPLADMKNVLGEADEAILLLKGKITRQPQDARLRELLVRLLHSKGACPEALKVAQDGVKYNPAAWRLQRHIARLQRTLSAPTESVIGHYDAAFRHNKGDVSLIAEYGTFLFTEAKYNEAERIFAQGRELPGTEKKVFREAWIDATGELRVFSGHVYSINGALGHVMSTPENFTVPFWRTREPLTSLRLRDKVSFSVRFSALGPMATSIQPN